MYKVIWLRQDYDLEKFKGKIIEVLDKQYVSNKYDCEWTFQCLVEVNEEEQENE